MRIRGPTPGSGFRARAMVRDLERKDEAQRVTRGENEVLGDCSCPHSRFAQLYPIFHFLSLPQLLTTAVSGLVSLRPQPHVPGKESLGRDSRAGVQEEATRRHWDIEREQGCGQARTVAEARMSFKRAVGTSCFVEPAGTPLGRPEEPKVLTPLQDRELGWLRCGLTATPLHVQCPLPCSLHM